MPKKSKRKIQEERDTDEEDNTQIEQEQVKVAQNSDNDNENNNQTPNLTINLNNNNNNINDNQDMGIEPDSNLFQIFEEISSSQLIFAHLSKNFQKKKKRNLIYSISNHKKSGYMCFCLENEVIISPTSFPFFPIQNFSTDHFKNQWDQLPADGQRSIRNEIFILKEAKFSKYTDIIFLGILDSNGLLYLWKEFLGKWTSLPFFPVPLLLKTWSQIFTEKTDSKIRNFSDFSCFEFIYCPIEQKIQIVTSSELLNVTDFFKMEFNTDSQEFFFEHFKCRVGFSFNNFSFKKGKTKNYLAASSFSKNMFLIFSDENEYDFKKPIFQIPTFSPKLIFDWHEQNDSITLIDGDFLICISFINDEIIYSKYRHPSRSPFTDIKYGNKYIYTSNGFSIESWEISKNGKKISLFRTIASSLKNIFSNILISSSEIFLFYSRQLDATIHGINLLDHETSFSDIYTEISKISSKSFFEKNQNFWSLSDFSFLSEPESKENQSKILKIISEVKNDLFSQNYFVKWRLNQIQICLSKERQISSELLLECQLNYFLYISKEMEFIQKEKETSSRIFNFLYNENKKFTQLFSCPFCNDSVEPDDNLKTFSELFFLKCSKNHQIKICPKNLVSLNGKNETFCLFCKNYFQSLFPFSQICIFCSFWVQK